VGTEGTCSRGLLDTTILRSVEVRAEFTVYPFRAGEDPPAYVHAAIEAMNAAGLNVEVAVLGQVVTGEAKVVLEALRQAQAAALEAGATRIAVNLERRP
jgi:uncharacterized protein YqgV (UPF0045/DUF77 family)